MDTQLAINAVYERVLGQKPEQPGASQDQWRRHRQKLSTYCTRVKKWLRLLGAFGYGILFKDAWYVVLLTSRGCFADLCQGAGQV